MHIFKRLMRRLVPTPTVLALIVALALVSGGSAVAGSLVTSAQIKDRTIQMKDLNKKTIKSLKGKKGKQGVSGAQGVAGEQGEQGIQGTQGPQGEAGTARGVAMIQPNGTVSSPRGTFQNLTVVHPATGVYCFGSAPGTSTGIGNYGLVMATPHGQDFTKYAVTINLEYGSQCNPHGGHGAFVTKLDGTPIDGYFVIALM